MPIPKKLLETGFATFSRKRLRSFAEHNEICGSGTMLKAGLCAQLSRDPIYFLSCSWDFTRDEIHKTCKVFGIETGRRSKTELLTALQGFVDDYDKIQEKPTYEVVFGNTATKEFGKRLNDWVEVRRSQVPRKKWTEGELILWDIQCGFWEINGNGLPAIFEHGDDKFPFRFLSALETIGASKAVNVITRLGEILFKNRIPSSRRDRLRILLPDSEEDAENNERRWRILDRPWRTAAKEVPGLVNRYARENPEAFKP